MTSQVNTIESTVPDELYHGTPEIVAELRPSMPVFRLDEHRIYNDSRAPVVCFTDVWAVAVFAAIAPRDGLKLSFGWWQNQWGGLDFYHHPKRRQAVLEGVGYVATVSSGGMKRHDGSYPEGYPINVAAYLPRQPEYRAEHTVPVPEDSWTRVTFQDFEDALVKDPRNDFYFRSKRPVVLL